MSGNEVDEQMEYLEAAANALSNHPKLIALRENVKSIRANFTYRLETDHHRREMRLQNIDVEQLVQDHDTVVATQQVAAALVHRVVEPDSHDSFPRQWHMLIYSIAQISLEMNQGTHVVLHSRAVPIEATKRMIRPLKLVFDGQTSSRLYYYMQALHHKKMSLDRIHFTTLATILEYEDCQESPPTIQDIANRIGYAPSTVQKGLTALNGKLSEVDLQIIKQDGRYMLQKMDM